MTSVYLYDYDLCFLGLVIGWIGAHGWRNGWLRGERELLLVLWLLPPCGLLVVAWTEVQWMPLMLALCLWQIVRRMRLERLAMEREARAVVDAGQERAMSDRDDSRLLSLVAPFYNEAEVLKAFFARVIPVPSRSPASDSKSSASTMVVPTRRSSGCSRCRATMHGYA